jgi:alpha-tubulin suppressor-like RCC1 family protein
MKSLARWAPLVLSIAGIAGCGAGSGARKLGGGTLGTGGGSAGAGGGGAGGSLAFEPLTATAVALGAAHTCALLSSGEVACWGDGSRGQLGDGVAQPGYHRAFAAKVPGLTGVTGIRAGGNTTCAILSSGVACWGDGAYGQLGDGMAWDGYGRATPAPVQGLPHVLDLSVGGLSACAVVDDGSVRCWGRNTPEGWLGFVSADCGPYNTTMNAVDQPCEAAPREVMGVSGAVSVATGGDHTCAVLGSGGIVCWGADDFGQLGDGFSGTQPHDPSPKSVLGIFKAVRVALGASHTCAIAGDARGVSCWGDNSFGQLGIGTNALDSNQTKPVPAVGLDHVVDLDAAVHVSCAVLKDSTVSCWGDASHLFPPAPSPLTTDAPTAEMGVTFALAVRTGGSHACALLASHSVVCWGLDDQGQLGNGKLSSWDANAPVAAP